MKRLGVKSLLIAAIWFGSTVVSLPAYSAVIPVLLLAAATGGTGYFVGEQIKKNSATDQGNDFTQTAWFEQSQSMPAYPSAMQEAMPPSLRPAQPAPNYNQPYSNQQPVRGAVPPGYYQPQPGYGYGAALSPHAVYSSPPPMLLQGPVPGYLGVTTPGVVYSSATPIRPSGMQPMPVRLIDSDRELIEQAVSHSQQAVWEAQKARDAANNAIEKSNRVYKQMMSK